MICLFWDASKPKFSHHYTLLLFPKNLAFVVLNLIGRVESRGMLHGHGHGGLGIAGLEGRIVAGHGHAEIVFGFDLDAPVRVLLRYSVDNCLGLGLDDSEGDKSIAVFIELSLGIGLFDAG